MRRAETLATPETAFSTPQLVLSDIFFSVERQMALARSFNKPEIRLLFANSANYWFWPILSELIGAATESANINRDRAPSDPVKVVVTNQPHSRPNAGIGVADNALRLGPDMRRSRLKYIYMDGHLWLCRLANQNTKETTNPNRKGRKADPPARYALRHPAEKRSKKRTGQGPTKTTTTKICQGHSDEKPLCRNSQKMH